MHFRNCGMSKSALRRESQPRTKFDGRSIWPDLYFFGVRGCVVAVGLALLTHVARAEATCPCGEDCSSPELCQPPVCSPLKPKPPELKDYCEIKTVPGTERHEIKVNLKAHSSEIKVGGYKVTTEHYNDSYLTPVIEALPGDTVAAHLENSLPDLKASIGGGPAMAHRDAGVNPTNLHYFHGGIVSPNNARRKVMDDARKGTGDNIYVWLKNGTDSKPFDFDFTVPIPGKDQLDAGVLEGVGKISHPTGLNWYHSHLHGISSNQVMGGMSGLLSVGEDNAAVKARCKPKPGTDKVDEVQCNADTTTLQERTIVKYAMLRDISLKNVKEVNNAKTADWAPEQRDFRKVDNGPLGECPVWKEKGSPSDFDRTLRKGFCQRDENSAWLFTLNGQRFPTITVAEGKNLLLRLGNLSPNVAYWLELENTSTGPGPKIPTKIPLTILSLDGVVPARPVDSEGAKIPVDAISTNDLLLMPASRAEIYVRNDLEEGHSTEQVYILRTKGLNAGIDRWPEIQLARIVLEPSKPRNGIALALNVPIEKIPPVEIAFKKLIRPQEAIPPIGCVRDLKPGEHRRVTFEGAKAKGIERGASFGVMTEIMRPPKDHGLHDATDEGAFEHDATATVEASFEEYELKQKDGRIDWEGERGPNHGPNHVCIHLDHKRSHKQLWVLTNTTGMLHNFHIHQMKFRLATLDELLFDYHMRPPRQSHTCNPIDQCKDPDYKLYDVFPDPKTIWHDTIPVPPSDDQHDQPVFVIMSFDDPLQVGRFVYHCHILKHEDVGLMAPIEVWGP
jgi:FtsP/CotA-like multicopper oxidase with cupredoxin domain